jgi:hypothetical protein
MAAPTLTAPGTVAEPVHVHRQEPAARSHGGDDPPPDLGLGGGGGGGRDDEHHYLVTRHGPRHFSLTNDIDDWNSDRRHVSYHQSADEALHMLGHMHRARAAAPNEVSYVPKTDSSMRYDWGRHYTAHLNRWFNPRSASYNPHPDVMAASDDMSPEDLQQHWKDHHSQTPMPRLRGQGQHDEWHNEMGSPAVEESARADRRSNGWADHGSAEQHFCSGERLYPRDAAGCQYAGGGHVHGPSMKDIFGEDEHRDSYLEGGEGPHHLSSKQAAAALLGHFEAANQEGGELPDLSAHFPTARLPWKRHPDSPHADDPGAQFLRDLLGDPGAGDAVRKGRDMPAAGQPTYRELTSLTPPSGSKEGDSPFIPAGNRTSDPIGRLKSNWNYAHYPHSGFSEEQKASLRTRTRNAWQQAGGRLACPHPGCPPWEHQEHRFKRGAERTAAVLGHFEAAGADDYGLAHRPIADGAPAHDLHEGYSEDVYTHPQYWTAGGVSRADREGLAQLRKARGNPDHPVTIYRASPPGASYRMHTGDWVSLSPSYAQQHIDSNGNEDWHVHKAVVPAEHVRDAGTDVYKEQGYWGPDIDSQHHSGPRPEIRAQAAEHEPPEMNAEYNRQNAERRARMRAEKEQREASAHEVVAHFEAEAAADPDRRQWGHYTLTHRTEDLGERKPRHFIEAHTPEGALVGRLNYYGTTGLVHRIEVAGPEDDVANGMSHMGDGREHGHRGLATAMWDWGQEMRPKPKHSKDQTEQGKNWVRGLKSRERPEPPQDGPSGITATAATEYGPKPPFRPAPEHFSDDEKMAHWDRERQIKDEWEAGINHGISTGQLHPDRAKELGHYFDGHQTDERGNHKWQPLPEHLYHVTTDLPGVREHGLKTRSELAQQRGGHGLGGGPDDMISLTDDHDTARGILRAVHEFHHVVNGRYTPAQIWEDAKAGKGAEHPFHEGVAGMYHSGWRDGDPVPEGLHHVLNGTEAVRREGWGPPTGEVRTLDPDRRREQAASFYKTFAGCRSYAGGPEDPLFFSTDTKAFAAKDPKDFAVVHVRPRPGAMGHPVSALGEWRTGTGDALETHRAESLEGGHLKEASLSKETVMTATAARYEPGMTNPHTRGGEWFHGSQSRPKDLQEGFHVPTSHDHGNEEMNGHLSHWNTFLGAHFAASHGVASHFARNGSSVTNWDNDGYDGPEPSSRYEERTPRDVTHARLHLSNPKVYSSEFDMDSDAYEHETGAGNWISGHFGEGYEDEDPSHPDYDPGEVSGDEEWPLAARFRHDSRQPLISKEDRGIGSAVFSHATSVPRRTQWLSSHPDKAGIAARFRQRLADQGHDGILYGNEFEGEHSEGGKHGALSAIAFHPHQVEITQHHDVDRPCLPHDEAQAQRRRMPQPGQEMLPGVEEHADQFPNGFRRGSALIAHFTASLKGMDPSGIRRHLAEAHGYTSEDIDSIRWHGRPHGDANGLIADNLRMSHEGDHLRRGDWENRESEEHAPHVRHPDGPPANPEQDLYSFKHPGSGLDLDRERAKAHAEERRRPKLEVPRFEHGEEEPGHGLADVGQSMLGFDKDLSDDDRQYVQDAINHSRRRAPASEPINAGDAQTMARSIRAGDHLRDNGWTVHDTGRYPRGVSISVGEHHRATLSPNTPSGWHVRTHPADYGSAAGHIHHDIDVPDHELSGALHTYYGSPQIRGEMAAQRAEMIAEGRHEASLEIVAHFEETASAEDGRHPHRDPSVLTGEDHARLNRIQDDEANALDPASDEHEYVWGFRQNRPHEEMRESQGYATENRDAHHQDAAARGHDMTWEHHSGWGNPDYAQQWHGTCKNCGAELDSGARSSSSGLGRSARDEPCTGPGTAWQNDLIKERQVSGIQDAVSQFGKEVKDIHDRQWLKDQGIEPTAAVVAAAEASQGPWYHGTDREFAPGSLIEPGHDPNWAGTTHDTNREHVYATPDSSLAHAFGTKAATEDVGGYYQLMREPRVYRVEPTGSVEPDPEDDRGGRMFRSRHPLRVAEDVTGHAMRKMLGLDKEGSAVSSQVTSAYDWNTDEGPFTWDEIAQRHPRTYGDDEDHVPGMGEGGGHDIADAAAELYHDRPSHPYRETEGELHPSYGGPEADIEFHPRTVDPSRIDYMRAEPGDERVNRARKGYEGQHPEKVPPLILVHRHGVFHVADGHHRANGATKARKPVRAYVAYSPHENEPFAGKYGEPPQRGPFNGADTESRPPALLDQNGVRRRISYPGFPHEADAGRPAGEEHTAAVVAHFDEDDEDEDWGDEDEDSAPSLEPAGHERDEHDFVHPMVRDRESGERYRDPDQEPKCLNCSGAAGHEVRHRPEDSHPVAGVQQRIDRKREQEARWDRGEYDRTKYCGVGCEESHAEDRAHGIGVHHTFAEHEDEHDTPRLLHGEMPQLNGPHEEPAGRQSGRYEVRNPSAEHRCHYCRNVLPQYRKQAMIELEPVHDVVLAPEGPLAVVVEAANALGSWEPQDKDEATAAVRAFAGVFPALRNGLLRLARVIEEMPVDPEIADMICEMARSLQGVSEDVAEMVRRLPPEASWQEPGPPNR